MKSFGSSAPITNPANPSETKDISIWPVHCVQDTEGAQLIPELDASKLDVILEKGKDKSVEMLSAFADVFGNKTEAASLDLSGLLRSHGIDCVHVVGLAGDFCVKHTALDARKEGFKVFVIDEGVRSVNEGSEGWGATVETLQGAKVKIVSIGNPEITAMAWSIASDDPKIILVPLPISSVAIKSYQLFFKLSRLPLQMCESSLVGFHPLELFCTKRYASLPVIDKPLPSRQRSNSKTRSDTSLLQYRFATQRFLQISCRCSRCHLRKANLLIPSCARRLKKVRYRSDDDVIPPNWWVPCRCKERNE